MAAQVKIFMDSSPDELEQKVNSWLAENPDIAVEQAQLHIGSTLDVSGGGTHFWSGLSYYTLLYLPRPGDSKA